LTIQFGNMSSVTAAPVAGQYVVQVTRLEGPAPVNAA